jgi:hypothetical protein
LNSDASDAGLDLLLLGLGASDLTKSAAGATCHVPADPGLWQRKGYCFWFGDHSVTNRAADHEAR